MNRQLLIILETLENSDSISAAAQKLYLSQPYISRLIKKYENKYNVILVKRSTRPIELTPAGHLLINYLRKDFQLQNQLESEMEEYEQNTFPTLRMGITPPLGENFNLTVLPQLFNKFPNLRTNTVEFSTTNAEKAFKDGQLDLFVGNTVQLPHVENYPLHSDQQILVLDKSSHLYRADRTEILFKPTIFQKLNHEKFIVVDSEIRYQNIINNYFNDIGIQFYPSIHVRDSTTAFKLAALGLGNMTTSIEAIKSSNCKNINYIKLPIDKVCINFSLSISRNRKLGKEITYASNIIKKDFTNKILSL
ncbi:LysR family transcriptional regulator [Lactobacillus sp. ESL0681]|uniref:LysR family transcriptional regulator n=1 Tax=Lactobacillus sp. ESL0681 TaxID=2983211 RepID=UPI0023F6CC94|nr:LysR family transcriptional regulator [Lactobacillus sp. ESL0681]WEV40055.1 LysR family transcriptional regulator [Lactobacillus sp. ESL0681]